MIEHRAIQCLRGIDQAPGCAAVSGARPRIAAWMIVGQDEAGTAMPCGIDDDLAQGEDSAGFVARMPAEVQAARLVVYVRDPEAFASALGIGDASRKEVTRGRQAVELEREFGTLISHANSLVRHASRHDRNPVGVGPDSLRFGGNR